MCVRKKPEGRARHASAAKHCPSPAPSVPPPCQARFLTYSVTALNVVFAFLAIALFGVRQDNHITGREVR